MLSKKSILLISILILSIFLFLPNFKLSIFSIFIFILIFWKSYEFGKPNFIFWGLLFQWLTVSIESIYASISGVSLEDLFRSYDLSYTRIDRIEDACFLNLSGLLFYLLGIQIFLKDNWSRFSDDIRIDFKQLTNFYVIFSILASLLNSILFKYPGFTQIFSFVTFAKWGFWFLFSYISFLSLRNRFLPFLLVFSLELFLNIGTFFAGSMVNLILFMVLARLMIPFKRKIVGGFVIAVLAFIFVNFAIYWTAVKSDFRSYITGGKRSQLVVVSRSERLDKLQNLVLSVDRELYLKGSRELIRRIGYISFTSNALSVVPDQIPHENGKILLNSFLFYIKPRILFPDKPVINDSEHTRKYTKLDLAGVEAGTSISLGLFADAYVDFGFPLMLGSVFFIAFITGLEYRYLIKKCKSLTDYILVTSLFFFLVNVASFNTIKVIGPLIINFICCTLYLKFFSSWVNSFIGDK